MIRIYRNNEEGTAIVEHVEMTRAELDAALSVARETAYRDAAEEAEARAGMERGDEAGCFTEAASWCLGRACRERASRGET